MTDKEILEETIKNQAEYIKELEIALLASNVPVVRMSDGVDHRVRVLAQEIMKLKEEIFKLKRENPTPSTT